MHPILARIPFIRRPFYQRDVARRERDRALRERDEARQTLAAALQYRPQPQRRCLACGEPVEAWQPYYINSSNLSDFLKRARPIGSNLDRFACPRCGATDRERHLCLYFERLGILETIRGGCVLHMAPERVIERRIRDFRPATYIKGDRAPMHPSIQRIDLQRIPFPDGSFDMALCNHVLEHVDDPAAALRELHRVLKPGGRLVCQTPYAAHLTNTLEDPLFQSEADRRFFYMQEDHVRLFGRDIAGIIAGAGFVGRLVPHAEILPDVDPEAAGVNDEEPFFDFVRGEA
jgi:SAM-dependent methyltransferase